MVFIFFVFLFAYPVSLLLLRQDFGNIRVLRGRPAIPKAYEQHNYIVILPNGSDGELTLNKYKTSSKYKTLTRQIPDKLIRVILASLRKQPRDYLFVDDRGLPYTKKNSYTKYSNRILQKIFNKRVTVSTLRHSFISSIDFNASTPRDLFEKSRNMAHSIAMQQLYRKKPDCPSTNVVIEKQVPDIVVVKEGGEEKESMTKQKYIPDASHRFITVTW